MKQFLIKAGKGNNDFGMTEPAEHLYFYSPSLKDLYGTLRCITAKGYNIPKAPTLSKKLKARSGYLQAQNPLFHTTMFEVWQITQKPQIQKELQYTNSFGFAHILKLVKSEHATPLYE